MPLDTRISLALLAAQSAPADLAAASAPLKYLKDWPLLNGVGASQADRIVADNRTIAASGTDTLDLNGGGLLDLLNVATVFAKIRAVLIVAAATNTNNVVLTRPAANGVPLFSAAGDALPIKPGGMNLWIAPDIAGVAVTAGTGDLIDIVNSGAGTAVVYDLVIIGTSA
ncbi:MAG: hypothetical protein ABIQ18_02335 [Umezawaea sp.]